MTLMRRIQAPIKVTIVAYVLSLNCDPKFAGVEPKDPMSKAFDKFGLDSNTQDFVGHAMCLYRNDEYVFLSFVSCIYCLCCVQLQE